jgi:hypothetical protein
MKKEPTIAVKCNCSHEFQDKEYGPGVRVATPVSNKVKYGAIARCTVCGRNHFITLK